MMNYKCSEAGSLSGSGEAPDGSRVFLSPPGAREVGTPGGVTKSSHVSQNVTSISSHCHSADRGRVMKHSFNSYLRSDSGVNEDSKIEASVTEYLLDTRGL